MNSQAPQISPQMASMLLGICQGLSLGTSSCAAPPAPAPATPAPAAAPAAPVPVITPQQLAQQAEAQIQLAAPALQLSPDTEIDPEAKQIVNAPTWAWLPAGEWVPLHATAAAGPVVVTATATPLSININYTDGGSGHSVSCSGPGTPFDAQLASQEDPSAPLSAASPDCGWTFRTVSDAAPGGKDTITATVTYDVTWAVQGAAGGGDLGDLASPVTNYAVPVAQIQVLNTN
jgi:hypothetical protein